MFGFLNDIGNYESRKVDCWGSEDGKKMVSTAAVSDGRQPFETAFQHPEYNDGYMVIVEAYGTREAALEGHGRWLKIMLEGPLPQELRDCCNAGVAQVLESIDGDSLVHKRTLTS